MATRITAKCSFNKQGVMVCYPPISGGGGVQSVVAGTNITVDDTDPQNPIVSATGGGSGITGVGTVDYVPKVLTVSSGNIVTVGNSVFQDTADTASARKIGVNKGVQFDVINGTFYGVNRVLSYITDNGQADLGTTTGTVRTGISAKPNNAYFGTCLNNDFATFDSYIRTDENAELYIMSTSIPITSTGVLTVAADGKIGVASAGGGTTTNPLTIGTGLSGTSFDGSAPITIQIDSTVATLTGAQALSNKTGLISQWTNDSGYLTSLSGAVISVSGTTNRITSTGGATPVIDISSSYVGQSSITTLGTIATGVWNGTIVTGTYGGTGINNGSNTITLAGNLVTTGAFNTTLAAQATVTTTLPPVATTLAGKTGTMVANQIAYWSDANQLTGVAGFTFDGTILTNGTTTSTSTATPRTLDMGGTYANSVVSSKAKWKLYNDGTAANTYGIGISVNQFNLFTASAASFVWLFNDVQKLSFSSSVMTYSDAVNVAVGTTTGTKIGTATSQKIAFWNKTPIVQPTTAVAAATFVTNTSLIANDTATFDGYTIGQVVKALRNIGLLA